MAIIGEADLPSIVFGALVGLGWGFMSDRLAARWPAHEDGSRRAIDWRTPLVAAAGAAGGALLVTRFGAQAATGEVGTAAVMVVYVLALVVLFATDLDQRLLPDVITLPLIALALLADASGLGPYVHDPSGIAVAAVVAVAVPIGLYLLSIPFGAGAIGQGDLKLLVSVGLLGGPLRLFSGLIAGAIIAAVVIVVLIALRRITLRSYVPYGPFLIVGAAWALLVFATG